MCTTDGHFSIFGNTNVRQEEVLTYDLRHPLFIGEISNTTKYYKPNLETIKSGVCLIDWRTLSGVLCQTPYFFVAAIACIKLNVLL